MDELEVNLCNLKSGLQGGFSARLWNLTYVKCGNLLVFISITEPIQIKMNSLLFSVDSLYSIFLKNAFLLKNNFDAI